MAFLFFFVVHKMEQSMHLNGKKKDINKNQKDRRIHDYCSWVSTRLPLSGKKKKSLYHTHKNSFL